MSRGAEPCEHLHFHANVLVVRLEDIKAFEAEVNVRCAECGVRFRWLGLPIGLSRTEPKTDVSGFELRAPIAPDAHMTSVMAEVPAVAP